MLGIMERRGGAEKMLGALLDHAEQGELRAIQMVLTVLGEAEGLPGMGCMTISLAPEIQELAK